MVAIPRGPVKYGPRQRRAEAAAVKIISLMGDPLDQIRAVIDIVPEELSALTGLPVSEVIAAQRQWADRINAWLHPAPAGAPPPKPVDGEGCGT